MLVSDAVSSEGPEDHRHPIKVFCLAPEMHRDVSSSSESLYVEEHSSLLNLFKPFVVPVPTILRPPADIKILMSSFSGHLLCHLCSVVN